MTTQIQDKLNDIRGIKAQVDASDDQEYGFFVEEIEQEDSEATGKFVAAGA